MRRLAVLLLLLVGFGARLYALDARPLWWDEGLTLTFSRLAPAANADFAVQTEDVNPPVYRWAVGALTVMAGTNVFTTRLLNVYAGVLVLAALTALARLGFGGRTALIALLLAVFAPMQIYYAQEAKGYMFEAAALLIGLLLWWRIHAPLIDAEASPARWPVYAGFALTVTLALGANYLAIFALVVENLIAAIWSIGKPLTRTIAHWTRWGAAQAIGGLVLLPFVLATLGGTSDGLSATSAEQIVYGPAAFLWRFLLTFAGGVSAEGLLAVAATTALGVLALVGLFTGHNRWRWIWGVWLVLPLILGFFFHLSFPWFFPRFLLYTQPALLILAAAGLSRIEPPRIPAGEVVLAGLNLWLAGAVYQQPPRFPEDPDWPSLYETLSTYADPDDLVIMSLPWMPGYMAAYSDVQPDWVLGFFADETIDAELAGYLAGYDRIWQIDYNVNPLVTPTNTLQSLRGEAALAYAQPFGIGHLALYTDTLHTDQIEEYAFANGISVLAPSVDTSAQPGDVLGLRLQWQTDDPVDARLVRFLHLMTPDGRLAAQVDREPVMGTSPTYSWVPGEVVTDPAALLLPVDLPVGEYELWIGLYDRDTLQRVPLTGGQDHIRVGTVQIREGTDVLSDASHR